MADEAAPPPTTEPRKKNGMRDLFMPMVQHAFSTHGPTGGKAAMMGVPYWQRGQGVINPQAEYDQFRMLQDWKKAQREKTSAPQTETPLPPLDPSTPVAQASTFSAPAPAPTAAPVAAAQPATQRTGLADLFGVSRSSTRKVRGGGFGGGGSGGAFGQGFF